MKKQTFPDFVRQELKGGIVLNDEQLCSRYVKRYYTKFLLIPTEKNIAVIGKRYESCRKALSKMRTDIELEELKEMRVHRKNGSEKIYFRIV